MAHEPIVIPEKIYFKIGEVCDLLGVQAHVLRYWETEFSMLSPQKNKSGQRSYRRRDVEIVLRIKQLLYSEMFTIAGARKKLQTEIREGNGPKPPVTEPVRQSVKPDFVEAPTLFDTSIEIPAAPAVEKPQPMTDHPPTTTYNGDQREAVKVLAGHLLDLREMLKPNATQSSR